MEVAVITMHHITEVEVEVVLVQLVQMVLDLEEVLVVMVQLLQ
jgi:hypothetical protein